MINIFIGCTSVADSLLTKGLTLATTTMMLNSDSIIGYFNASFKTASPAIPVSDYNKPTTAMEPYQNATIRNEEFQENSRFKF